MKALRDDILKVGVGVARNFLPSSEVKACAQALEQYGKDNILRNEDIHHEEDQLNGKQISSMHNIFTYFPEYFSLIEKAMPLNLFQETFQETGKYHSNSSFFLKKPGLGKEIFPHQDNAYFNLKTTKILTFWVAVDDVSIELKSGGLYYFAGSHLLGDLAHYPGGRPGTSMRLQETEKEKLKNLEVKNFSLQSGDCLIHTGHIVHGSDANKSQYQRRGFNFTLVEKNATLDEERYQKYRYGLEHFLKEKS